MSDSVEWLRAKYRRHGEIEDNDAADEIERLRELVTETEELLREARDEVERQSGLAADYDAIAAERDRLAARLAEAERRIKTALMAMCVGMPEYDMGDVIDILAGDGASDNETVVRPLERGDYVLASKYSDGDPQDHWYVGFYRGVCGSYDPPRYDVEDDSGNLQRGNGFRRVERISPDCGAWLVRHAKEIAASGKSIWEWARAAESESGSQT